MTFGTTQDHRFFLRNEFFVCRGCIVSQRSSGNMLMTQVSFSRGQLKCDGTRAETRFRLCWNGWVHLHLRERQFGRLPAAEVCASAFMVGSNAGYAMLRGSVKGTGYTLHLPVSPSLPLPRVTICHHISTGVYNQEYQHNGLAVQAPSSIIRFAVLQNHRILNILSEHLTLGQSLLVDSTLMVYWC